MAAMTYDRREQDLGNILLLEHVNVRVPDQQAATLFYIAGLGLTRDPYLMVSVENMWANAGQTQFHLPTGKPNVVQGHVELIVPDLDALTRRLASVRQALAGTQIAKYDATDNMPVAMKDAAWQAVLAFAGNQSKLDSILQGLDKVQATAYTSA